MDPRGNVLEDSDVLCANRSAMVRVTRLSRLRRSAYPLASACCGAVECLILTQPTGSLRTSAHTGVAIRAPSTMLVDRVLTKGERIATPDDVGHWLAMTEKNPTLRNHSTVEFAKRRLFYKVLRMRRTTCSTIESVEAVRSTPRTGLNRVNCTPAHT